ncbi:MAG TPA: tRNA (adenosine(37)-N6)-threonylcarbamoyltransferase complex ATPase subunit type 1 TsaE [Bacillales bacterium]|nr:tRNA (adenosine(37)-N6)-threonylcarbamoyltransferase complex ATPase subunit type 1 TsaE [Bacillales bacterium]
MHGYETNTHSENETFRLGERLAKRLKPGDLITLSGDLGAGKTTFTKGLAAGLGINRTVNSPTFTIIKEYEGRLPLYHMDVYRLEDGDEDLGFEEYFDGDGVTVVEWAERIADWLPEERLEVSIEHASGEDERRIAMIPAGPRYDALCKELNDENFGD